MRTWQTRAVAVVAACAALILIGRSAADDKDKPALSGVWKLQGGEPKIEFADKETLKISPHGDSDVIVIVCKYTVEKEGRIKGKITELQGKEEVKQKAKEILPVGLEFSFKWTVKKDSATLDDMKGDNVDPLKGHLEGKYEKN